MAKLIMRGFTLETMQLILAITVINLLERTEESVSTMEPGQAKSQSAKGVSSNSCSMSS